MLKVKLLRKVKGLPYNVGDFVPVYVGRHGKLIWHVYKTIIVLPDDSYLLVTIDTRDITERLQELEKELELDGEDNLLEQYDKEALIEELDELRALNRKGAQNVYKNL